MYVNMIFLIIVAFFFDSLNGYVVIPNSVIDRRPFFLVNNLSDLHKKCITDAVTSFNQVGQYINVYVEISSVKVSPEHIAAYPQNNYISYISKIPEKGSDKHQQLAFSTLKGYVGSDNLFHINDIDIYISEQYITDAIACYNIVLHELGHVNGLMHNKIIGSVMNASVITGPNLKTLPESNVWRYHVDDLYGLWQYNKNYK